jgi:hypothetical protein
MCDCSKSIHFEMSLSSSESKGLCMISGNKLDFREYITDLDVTTSLTHKLR